MEIYPHLAPQGNIWLSAICGIAILYVEKFL